MIFLKMKVSEFSVLELRFEWPLTGRRDPDVFLGDADAMFVFFSFAALLVCGQVASGGSVPGSGSDWIFTQQGRLQATGLINSIKFNVAV